MANVWETRRNVAAPTAAAGPGAASRVRPRGPGTRARPRAPESPASAVSILHPFSQTLTSPSSPSSLSLSWFSRLLPSFLAPSSLSRGLFPSLPLCPGPSFLGLCFRAFLSQWRLLSLCLWLPGVQAFDGFSMSLLPFLPPHWTGLGRGHRGSRWLFQHLPTTCESRWGQSCEGQAHLGKDA